MISATFFGEITELGSRAVWYSDEEDSDDDVEDKTIQRSPKPIGPIDHEVVRSNIQVSLRRIIGESKLQFDHCIISLSTSAKFNNLKLDDRSSAQMIGFFDLVGKAFALPVRDSTKKKGEPETFALWLVFDASHQYIVGQEVGYFVEALRVELRSQFNPISINNVPIIILSQQFSETDRLEYLANCEFSATVKLPFVGKPLMPPSLIRNQFESALFEQFTLTLKPALIVCLPDPRNFWFDKTSSWPSVPDHVIDHRLNDDSLEKTLIFT